MSKTFNPEESLVYTIFVYYKGRKCACYQETKATFTSDLEVLRNIVWKAGAASLAHADTLDDLVFVIAELVDAHYPIGKHSATGSKRQDVPVVEFVKHNNHPGSGWAEPERQFWVLGQRTWHADDCDGMQWVNMQGKMDTHDTGEACEEGDSEVIFIRLNTPELQLTHDYRICSDADSPDLAYCYFTNDLEAELDLFLETAP